MSQEVTKKVAIIGVGNCGSQVAYLAEKKYSNLFDTIYINSSEADLAMVNTDTSLKFKIGAKEDHIEGSGKNRTKMKEYLMKDITNILGNPDLQQTISTKQYCFIITSAAGGTGSGAGPVLMEMMRQLFPDTNFILVGVLPQLSASLMEHGNELEFVHELYDILGENTTYMIYDNETVSDMPTIKGLETVNENIVEDLRVITSVDNYPTPYESIDDADMESIISTPGRLMVVRINKGITEKAMEDKSIDELIIKAIKNSCHAETDRNKRVTRWGIITYFTNEVNRLFNADLEGVRNFVGTPIERFNHNAINEKSENFNFLYMIMAGLSPINDRAKKTNDRIDELKDALAKDESNRYVLSGDGSSYDVLEARKKAEKRAQNNGQIDLKGIFNKFM